MNLIWIQFWVAFLGIFFLGLCTVLGVYAALFEDASPELAFALVTGLTGVTSPAVAYLFRSVSANGRA